MTPLQLQHILGESDSSSTLINVLPIGYPHVNVQVTCPYKVDGMTPTNDLESSNDPANVSKSGSPTITWDSSAECAGVPYAFHLATGIVMAVMCLICIVGNLLVLSIFARNVRLRTSSNLLIINLAIADFIMAAIDFPLFSLSSIQGCWSLGFKGCQVYGLTSSISGLVAINTLAAISFDRYVVVVRRFGPVDRMAKSTMAIIITAIWTLSIMWSALPFSGVSMYRLEGMGTSCTFNYVDQNFTNTVFFLALVIFNFFIPLIIIIFSYSRIYISVCQTKREVQLFQRNDIYSSTRQRMFQQAEIRTALVAILIISVFCITWTPYVAIAFVGMFHSPSSITPTVSMLPNIMAKLCTASNAILYSISHPEMRKSIKKLFNSFLPDSLLRAASGQSTPPNSAEGISLPTYL